MQKNLKQRLNAIIVRSLPSLEFNESKSSMRHCRGLITFDEYSDAIMRIDAAKYVMNATSRNAPDDYDGLHDDKYLLRIASSLVIDLRGAINSDVGPTRSMKWPKDTAEVLDNLFDFLIDCKMTNENEVFGIPCFSGENPARLPRLTSDNAIVGSTVMLANGCEPMEILSFYKHGEVVVSIGFGKLQRRKRIHANLLVVVKK